MSDITITVGKRLFMDYIHIRFETPAKQHYTLKLDDMDLQPLMTGSLGRKEIKTLIDFLQHALKEAELKHEQSHME